MPIKSLKVHFCMPACLDRRIGSEFLMSRLLEMLITYLDGLKSLDLHATFARFSFACSQLVAAGVIATSTGTFC